LNVIITEWALQSYLELKSQRAFTDGEYRNEIRPKVEMLKAGYPSKFPELDPANNKSWSVASDRKGTITHCFKMKWHNLNGGKTKQMRLGVMIYDGVAYLCRAYTDKDHEHLEIAKLKIHSARIVNGDFEYRGLL